MSTLSKPRKPVSSFAAAWTTILLPSLRLGSRWLEAPPGARSWLPGCRRECIARDGAVKSVRALWEV